MTVKARVGRVRHVAFRIETADGGRVGRRDVEGAFRDAARATGVADAEAWRLTAFDGRRGLVRVPHTDAGRARDALPAVAHFGKRAARVVTLGTSGTIRAAKRRWLPDMDA